MCNSLYGICYRNFSYSFNRNGIGLGYTMITLEVKYVGPTDSKGSRIKVRTIYGVQGVDSKGGWKAYSYAYEAPCAYDEAVRQYIYDDSKFTCDAHFVSSYIGDSRRIYIQVWEKSTDTTTVTRNRG